MHIIRLLCLLFNSPQEHNTYPRAVRERHGISDNLTKLAPQLTKRQQAPPRSTTPLSQLPFNHASLCTLITGETNDPPTNSTIIELSTLRFQETNPSANSPTQSTIIQRHLMEPD
ncbi:hypothetical protein KC19_12G056500 [Ceratodon purpureus]|uniref:Uncharacterized protein n=1 Tax=Ceratodon purpureus TaxID=3225 RepID=A0A8T0G403_CERPU|nr:hypothetical protein KC19_12G056500 [Ceratodon purpureus]